MWLVQRRLFDKRLGRRISIHVGEDFVAPLLCSVTVMESRDGRSEKDPMCAAVGIVQRELSNYLMFGACNSRALMAISRSHATLIMMTFDLI